MRQGQPFDQLSGDLDALASGALNNFAGALPASGAPVAIDQGRGISEPLPEGLGIAEHVRQARLLPAPFPPSVPLSRGLQDAVTCLAQHESVLEEIWAERLAEMRACIAAHAEDERCLNSAVHPQMRSHVAKFPSLAFEALLRKYNYDDPAAARLLKGCVLTGDLEGRSSWPLNTDPSPAASGSALLERSGPRERKVTWKSVRPSPEDASLLKAAESDVASGKMLGPFFNDDEVQAALGSDKYVINKRFGIQQTDKCRPVDDFTASGVNDCCRADRNLTLSTLDHFFALVCAVSVAFPLSQVQFGKRDHHSAYRQLALCASALQFACVTFWHPALQRAVAYVHLALPFGPRAAVINYNRVAQAVSGLLQRMFHLPCDNFFDDFWLVGPLHLIQRIFDMFGEVHALLNLEIKVEKDLQPTFIGELLGHVVNLSGLPYTISNSDRRKAGILALVGEALRSGRLRPRVAGELAGKFAFACTALYGRVGRAALKPVYERQHAKVHFSANSHTISQQLRAALLCIQGIVHSSPPRVVLPSFFGSRPSTLAYTDGQGEGWIAAVIFPRPPLQPAYAAMQLPEDLCRLFAPRNPIEQIETAAVLLLFEIFAAELRDTDVRLFVDNVAAQGSLVRGFSRSLSQAVLCGAVWTRAALARVGLWVDRVESAANVADIPTRPAQRERFALLRSLGVHRRIVERERFVEIIRRELSALSASLACDDSSALRGYCICLTIHISEWLLFMYMTPICVVRSISTARGIRNARRNCIARFKIPFCLFYLEKILKFSNVSDFRNLETNLPNFQSHSG